MKAKVKKKPTITLEMTLEEASYLRELTQNPLIRTESDKDRKIREATFHALTSVIGDCR